MTRARFLALFSVAVTIAFCLGAADARDKGLVFAGLVPTDVLSPADLRTLQGDSKIAEGVLDGAYGVLMNRGCTEEACSEFAMAAAKEVCHAEPPKNVGVFQVIGPQKSRPVYHVSGLMTLFCPEKVSEPPSTMVLVRQDFAAGGSSYKAYAVRRRGLGVHVTRCDRRKSRGRTEWMDAREKPDYIGFLRHEGKAWAFALLANGERLIVFDLDGHVVVDQQSWGYRHLIREGDDVVLYAILIEPAPQSAIDQMPGNDLSHKEMALGQHRTWALHKIGKGSDEVIISALVPKFQNPHDDNPEIERLSAPVVKKARTLFDSFRKEGRMIDQLP